MANQSSSSSSPLSVVAAAITATTAIYNLTRGSNSSSGGYGLDATWDSHHQQQQQQGVGDSGAAPGDNEADGSTTTGVEHVVSIVVAICFGLIGLAGLLGNSLVILGT